MLSIKKAWRYIVDKLSDWLDPKCPHCGSFNVIAVSVDVANNRVKYKCKDCYSYWCED